MPQRATTAVRLFWNTPYYVLGRFLSVRRGYSQLRRMEQRFTGTGELAVGERFQPQAEPLPVRPSGSVTSTRSTAEHVHNLRCDAYSDGLALLESARAELLELARERPLNVHPGRTTSYAELMQDAAMREDCPLALIRDLAQHPLIRAVSGDPMIVDVVESYLGYRPERVSPCLFWSFKNGLSDSEREARSQTVRFHYDVHHYNFMYVSFYVLDTNERNGAHVLIAGSHRDKRARHLIGSVRISDEQALADYGPERIRTIAGPAGAGFFEDTSCYHKALPPLDGERLVLQLRYQ